MMLPSLVFEHENHKSRGVSKVVDPELALYVARFNVEKIEDLGQSPCEQAIRGCKSENFWDLCLGGRALLFQSGDVCLLTEGRGVRASYEGKSGLASIL